MASRAYWSGQLRLSLVSIPIEVVPATKSGSKISFHQIHKPSGSRVRYQKVVPGVGPVENEEIVKGYEIDKGKYVLLEDDEINDVKLEAKKSIDLTQFVDEDEIDQMYFEKPYFVLPEEDSDAEAYVVLRDALRKSKKVGLGQIVIRGQGSIVAISARADGLLMETLRYADELKKPDAVFKDVPNLKPDGDMVELAEQLIDKKSKKFDPAAFKDTYEDALRELIEAKAEHRKVRTIEEAPQSAKVINLMDALRRSVGGQGSSRRETSTRETPPRKGKRSSKNGKARGRSRAA
jgi:DNA end-binding protein Ku